MQVYKFGGASVKDAAAVRNVAAILRSGNSEPLIVVVSAMGKITNHLERLVHAYFNRHENVEQILAEIRDFHLDIARALFPDERNRIYEELNNVFVELQWAIEEEPAFSFDQHYDQIVANGEILATRIISAFLKQEGIDNVWLDARGLIQTDNTYRAAKVDFPLSQELVRRDLLPLLANVRIVVTQGFIGGTSENYTTTLGREGSDYTAALLAYFSDARQVVIWKDVPGVLNADPKYFRNTKKIDELSYHDAIELTYYGISVIHPKTIKPLQNKNIPLLVKSFLDPSAPGTVIRQDGQRSNVTSYIFREHQILISIQPKDFSFIAEDKLSEIFGIFSEQQVRINMMQNSAISFSVCTDDDERRTPALLRELQKQFNVLYNKDVQLMTIRNYDPETIAKLSENSVVLLEQRTRHTMQMVMKKS